MLTVKIKPLPHSAIEISGELPAEQFAGWRPAALKRLNQEVTIAGFRPGQAPEKVLIDKVGEDKLLIAMAELALRATYPHIIKEQNLVVLGRPEITLTKLAKANPLGFKIITAIAPSFKLPDYLAIAKTITGQGSPAPAVSETEIDETMKTLVSQWSAAAKNKGSAMVLTDEAVKHFTGLDSVASLRTELKKGLLAEKSRQVKDRERSALIGSILAKTEIDPPAILAERELELMLADLKHRLAATGLTFDKYLAHLKKTEAELETGWRPAAETEVKTSLLLQAIAAKEKLLPDERQIEIEVKALVEEYPKADPANLTAFVRERLTNRLVLEFLMSGGQNRTLQTAGNA